ncbi:MAG TPA: hypothetical protein VJ066_01520 [Candidatus Bathyarchaeia archaeon]|nr:hypothetical protein [Candidatus Bathyarchaeia archaeon]
MSIAQTEISTSLQDSQPTVSVSCGGWEGGLAVETGTSLKPGKCSKNARPTHRQLHALLGNRPRMPDSMTAKRPHRNLDRILQRTFTLATDKKE